MKIYYAGVIAGHDDFIDWEQKEKQCFEKMNLTQRLCSYWYKEVTDGYLKFRKSYEDENQCKQ